MTGPHRLYQSVARQLSEMIAAGAKDEGWRMPSERELAEKLGVSRPVIREAVIALEMRGVVEVRGRAGIVVLNPRGAQFSFDRDAGVGPFELLEARMAIESGAAAIAAEKISDADLDRLAQCLEQAQRETDAQLLHEKGDRDFHLLIARATGNDLIASMIEALWTLRDESEMWRKLHDHIHAPSLRPLWIGDHHAVLAALRSHNPDAAYRAMVRHIRHVTDELMEADERGRFLRITPSEHVRQMGG